MRILLLLLLRSVLLGKVHLLEARAQQLVQLLELPPPLRVAEGHPRVHGHVSDPRGRSGRDEVAPVAGPHELLLLCGHVAVVVVGVGDDVGVVALVSLLLLSVVSLLPSASSFVTRRQLLCSQVIQLRTGTDQRRRMTI